MNNDTPSFRDTIEEVVSEPEKEVEKVEEPKAEEKSEEPKAEEKPETESKPEEETEEAFAEKPELEGKTPEELDEIYNKWQKSYTAKRQIEVKELKDARKQLEKLKAQATTKVDAETDKSVPETDTSRMSVKEYTEYMKNLSIEQAREAAREEYKTLRGEEIEDNLASKALEQFTATDERLDETNPNYDERFKLEVQREMAEKLDEHLSKNNSYKGFDSKKITQNIIKVRDEALEEIIKKRTVKSTQMAKAREAKAKKSKVSGTTAPSSKINGDSIRDILENTMDGQA